MIIKDSEKWVHHTCSNCDSDISQEEIEALHCNDCNQDIQSIKTTIALLNTPDDSTLPTMTYAMLEEIERLRVLSENNNKGFIA
jgi:reverse gyrase